MFLSLAPDARSFVSGACDASAKVSIHFIGIEGTCLSVFLLDATR